MTIKPNHLLKRLEPPIRPAYAGGGAIAPRQPLEAQSFGQLLTLVSDGAVRSDRPVTLAFTPNRMIEEDQLERMAAAADVAEASGARRALLLIDGRGLVLDVADRRLDEELTGGAEEQAVPLDAAVYVADADEQSSAGAIKFPGSGLVPPVIAEQLERAAAERGRAADPDPNPTESHDRRHAG